MKSYILLIFIFSILFYGCEVYHRESSVELYPPNPPPGKKSQVEISFNKDKVITIGNHSYIPLNLAGDPDEYAEVILNVLKQFESAHPEFEISDWKIEKQQSTEDRTDRIFGLWIDHKLVK